MLGEIHIFLRELAEGGQRFAAAGLIDAIKRNQQQVLARASIAEADIAQWIGDGQRFRISLLYQPTLIFLRIKQTMLLQKTSGGHRIGERQVSALHGDRAIEISIGPDIHQMAGKKGGNQHHGYRFAKRAAIEAAQLLPAPGGVQHLHKENSGHADKHQLPVARHFALVGVDHQFPYHRIEVQMETAEHRAVDQHQR